MSLRAISRLSGAIGARAWSLALLRERRRIEAGDLVHDLTFAFVFHAFHPDGVLQVK